MRRLLLFVELIFFLSPSVVCSQKVGLVLSGGGADALAHIGVIKALEENHIQIDYITGTSMGALIGALYATGIPIEEIEQFFTRPEFRDLSDGQVPKKFHYYYPVPKDRPIIVPIRFKKRHEGYNILLPTSFIPSETFDFEILKLLAEAEKKADYNFNNFKIPFRCVAADIVTKEVVVFKDGSLVEALRASMSYPFFIRPIKINGHLMYDGGIYNNFPSDVMCSDFNPDFIIGSNVSQNIPPPSDDDLFEQLQSILVKQTEYGITCKQGELIKPNTHFGTFNFEHAQEAIDSGYAAALRHMEHIKYHVRPKVNSRPDSAYFHRVALDSMEIGEIIFQGIDEKQARYAGSVLQRKRKKAPSLSAANFERNYYRLYQELYIEDIYTKFRYNTISKKYDAIVRVNPIKTITLDLGGNIATRPVSEGYAGVSYNNLSTFGFQMGFDTYFGKFYQALNAKLRFDFPTKVPVYIKPQLIVHNWNWFESRQANLFVDVKPNYIIEGELYTGVEIGIGVSNRIKAIGQINYLQMESKYYQTKAFTPSDTSDLTNFNGITACFGLFANSLNRKQYPFSGRRFHVEASYTFGNEYYTPGSTSHADKKTTTNHNFLTISFDYQEYLKIHKKLRVGYRMTAALSTMQHFNNYTSTVIQSPYYKPTPDSRTLFLESFHASQFGAFGLQFVYLPFKSAPYKNIQLRAEGYIFQPYQSYILNDKNEVDYGNPFADRFTILSAVLAFKTPLGPLSFSVNYYYNNPDISPEDEAPVTALLNFGYILFNKRGYR